MSESSFPPARSTRGREVASHSFCKGWLHPAIAAGIYSYLFLGNRSFNKDRAIVRRNGQDWQEFFLPALHPAALGPAAWALMGDNLFRLKTARRRHCLAKTEKSDDRDCAQGTRSYKQLRRSGTRSRPSFATSRAKSGCCGAPIHDEGRVLVRHRRWPDSMFPTRSITTLIAAIFDRCGLKYMVVEADRVRWAGRNRTSSCAHSGAEKIRLSAAWLQLRGEHWRKRVRKFGRGRSCRRGDGKPLECTLRAEDNRRCGKYLGVSPKNKIKPCSDAEEKDEKTADKSRGLSCLCVAISVERSETERSGAVRRVRWKKARSKPVQISAGYLGPGVGLSGQEI